MFHFLFFFFFFYNKCVLFLQLEKRVLKKKGVSCLCFGTSTTCHSSKCTTRISSQQVMFHFDHTSLCPGLRSPQVSPLRPMFILSSLSPLRLCKKHDFAGSLFLDNNLLKREARENLAHMWAECSGFFPAWHACGRSWAQSCWGGSGYLGPPGHPVPCSSSLSTLGPRSSYWI